jgi:hypothetical protein
MAIQHSSTLGYGRLPQLTIIHHVMDDGSNESDKAALSGTSLAYPHTSTMSASFDPAQLDAVNCHLPDPVDFMRRR